MSASPSPGPSQSSTPVPRYAITPADKQRAQLERLLKDPQKPAHIPSQPKEKTLRAPREMMKNVQGSSAGAGSGEFHVYKASRRREYERLKMMEEATQKETAEAEFERKRTEREATAEAKTSKNRAKRQKKKDAAKAKGKTDGEPHASKDGDGPDIPLKKRRLVNGAELVFKRPGGDSEDEADDGDTGLRPTADDSDREDEPSGLSTQAASNSAVQAQRITIHEDD